MTVWEELKARGLIAQVTDEAEIKEMVNNGKATFYIGFDPTEDSLHVGHFMALCLMKRLQEAGNKPIALIGGGTAMIGDPSGRTDMRQMMTKETIQPNVDCFKKQMSRFIDFSEGKALLVNNADWLLALNYVKLLRDVGACFSVNNMLRAECYKQRMEKGLSFLEFNYMLLQGYDFCVLLQKYGCRAQIAGADQWGNIVSGTELGRRRYDTELFGFTSPIITDSAGKKMGKSEGNAVWINEDKLPAYDYYQYFRNIGDAEVGKCLRIFTDLPMDEVHRLEVLQDKEINEAKKILAFEATKICRGETEAAAAQETAVKTFEKGIAGDDLPTVSGTKAGVGALDAFMALGFVASKGEARRLIKQAGLKLNDKVITDENYVITEKDIENGNIKLSQGKKKHGLLVLK